MHPLSLVCAVAGLITARPVSAKPSGCPSGNSLHNRLPSGIVGASHSTSGNVVTYRFSSLVDRNPENGVPGLIAYCVYLSPPTSPQSVSPVAVGENGAPWEGEPRSEVFSFKRPAGNPSNIALDGTTGITMGTATWNGAVPADQTILLHINDAAECDALYGGDPGTCFVLPNGTPVPDPSPTASSTATATATATGSVTPTSYPGGDAARAGVADAELSSTPASAQGSDGLIFVALLIGSLIVTIGLGVARTIEGKDGPR